MDRLEFLKRLGVLTVGASLVGIDAKAMVSDGDLMEDAIPEVAASEKINTFTEPLDAKLDKPITVMVIGAGNRGYTYARYAEKFPQSMKVVGVADLNPYRRERLQKKHDIPAENIFEDFNDALAKPKFADAVIIATPDNLHYEPCMKALALGPLPYHRYEKESAPY